VALKELEPKKLRDQSEHLLYEIQMLTYLEHYLETGEVGEAVAGLALKGLPVRNAVVEAFEIHARQLIEFLTHQRNSRRATARDWAKKWSVPQADQNKLKELRDAFSERVAHLSWKRSEFTPEQQLVIARKIVGKLRPLLLRFIEEADSEKLCEGFIDQARTALPIYPPEHLGVQRLDQLDVAVRVATTQMPETTRGTATQSLHETIK
jgi:hypothetical protein